MAEEKIGYSDLFEDSFLQPAIEQVKQLIDALDALEQKAKEQLKPALSQLVGTLTQINSASALSASTVRSVAQATATVAKSAKSLEEASRLKRRLEKNTEDLKKALTEEREEIKRLSVEYDNLKKQLKETQLEAKKELELQEALRKATEGVFESYADLADTYRTLADIAKDLQAANKTNTEEFRQVIGVVSRLEGRLKAIDESVGQFQRNVGDYRRSILESFALLAAGSSETGQKIAGLGALIVDAGVKAFQAAGGFKNFAGAIVAVGRSLRTAGILILLEALLFLLDKIREYFSTETQLRIQELQTQSELLRTELDVQRRLAAIETERRELSTETVAGRKRALELQVLQFRAQVDLLNAELKALEAARERKKIQEAEASKYDEQLQFQVERLEIEKQIIDVQNRQKEVIAQRRKTEEEIKNIVKEALDEARRSLPEITRTFKTQAEEVRALFAAQAKALAEAADAARKQLAGFPEALAELEAEVRRRAQLLRDILREEEERIAREQLRRLNELFIQFADASQKAIKLRAEAEKQARDEAIQAIEDELRAVDRLDDRTKQTITTLRELSEVKKEAFLARESLELLEKTLETEERAAQERIRQIQLEALERKKALLETIKDREQLRQAEIELEEETQRRILEIQIEALQDRIASERDFQESLKAIRAQYTTALATDLDVIIADLDKRLASAADRLGELQLRLAQQNVQIQERIAQAIAEQEKKQAEALQKQAEAVKKQIEELRKFADDSLNLVNRLAQQASEKRRESLEAESKALDRTLDVLIARAQAGSIEAQESIAEVLERQREIEARQRELRRQDQRRQLLLTALQAYTAAITRGSQQPLLDTIRDLTALSQIAQSLPTFYQGAEFINSQNALKVPNLARDAYIVRVHEGERIVPAHINAQLGGIKNEDLPKMLGNTAIDYDKLRDVLVYVTRKANKIHKTYDRL